MKQSHSKSISRRGFIEKATATAGLAALGGGSLSGNQPESSVVPTKLPREVWIATVSQHGLTANTPEEMVKSLLAILEKSKAYRPDIICLPEVFMTFMIRGKISRQEEMDRSERLLKDFTAFAQKNNCYVICPIYTSESLFENWN